MNSNETIFSTALEAIKEGNRPRARDLLTRLLKVDSNNAEYWLWMSACVETEKERSYCLKEVLRIDPDNQAAKRGLIMIGELPLDEKLVIPYKQQRQYVDSENRKGPSLLNKIMLAPNWQQFGLLAVVLVLVIFLGSLSFQGIKKLPFYPKTPTPITTLKMDLIFSPTPGAEETEEIANATAIPTKINQTPLSPLPDTPYTPTPPYVNTPHPQIEDYRSAMSAYERGEYSEMVRFLENAVEVEKNSPDLYYYLGEGYLHIDDPSNAYAAYNQAIKLEPYFAPAYVGRAIARLGIDPGGDKASKDDLKTAIEIDPNFMDAYLQLGIILNNSYDGRSALVELEKALELAPDSALVYHQMARANLLLDKPYLALSQALKAYKLDITLIPVYRVIAETYFVLEQPQKAADYLKIYVEYAEDDPQAWAWLGIAYYENNQEKYAEVALDTAIRLDLNTFDALLQRGILYLDTDRPNLAIEDLSRARSLQPRSFKANVYLGQVCYLLEDYTQAYTRLTYAAGLESDDQEALAVMYYWSALAHEELDAPSAANRDWQALLELPEDIMPAEWRETADQRLGGMITPGAETESVQGTPTPFRTPTRTITPTAAD